MSLLYRVLLCVLCISVYLCNIQVKVSIPWSAHPIRWTEQSIQPALCQHLPPLTRAGNRSQELYRNAGLTSSQDRVGELDGMSSHVWRDAWIALPEAACASLPWGQLLPFAHASVFFHLNEKKKSGCIRPLFLSVWRDGYVIRHRNYFYCSSSM